jgi:hypothetical protein
MNIWTTDSSLTASTELRKPVVGLRIRVAPELAACDGATQSDADRAMVEVWPH